jgi:pSer/pThr/pTyr-binding forkhead associated (FHA) protein
VVVLSGRQEGRIYLLARKTCRLGLDERAEIGIFGDPAVDRRHAEIEATDQGYEFRPLSTRGGSKINGKPVGGALRLHDGDRVQVGQTLLVFRHR